uniref:Uncharacterized protein n=1 Tax=Panagrolaimus sp. JU765 TaxID=591449 RepID=A0AC34PWN2_9BILA
MFVYNIFGPQVLDPGNKDSDAEDTIRSAGAVHNPDRLGAVKPTAFDILSMLEQQMNGIGLQRDQFEKELASAKKDIQRLNDKVEELEKDAQKSKNFQMLHMESEKKNKQLQKQIDQLKSEKALEKEKLAREKELTIIRRNVYLEEFSERNNLVSRFRLELMNLKRQKASEKNYYEERIRHLMHTASKPNKKVNWKPQLEEILVFGDDEAENENDENVYLPDVKIKTTRRNVKATSSKKGAGTGREGRGTGASR